MKNWITTTAIAAVSFTLLSTTTHGQLTTQVTTVSAAENSVTNTFQQGFRDGYKKAYPFSIAPIPPIPPIGKNNYADGFGLGYARGLLDKP